MDESDEVHEALTGSMRTGAMVLAQIASQVARATEARAADYARRAERDARELQDRATAARDTARLSYGQVTDSGWWDRAKPEQIADAYAAATAWRSADPVADRALPALQRELRDRYGIAPADVTAAKQEQQQPSTRTSAVGEAATATAVLDAVSAVEAAQAAAGQAAAAARVDRDTTAGAARQAPGAAAERAARATADTVGVVLRDRPITAANAAAVGAAAGTSDAAAAPAAAVAGARAAQADETATAPVRPTAERDRVRRRLEEAGQAPPARAVQARLTAAYGEGRAAAEIRAGTTAAASTAATVPERRIGLQRSR